MQGPRTQTSLIETPPSPSGARVLLVSEIGISLVARSLLQHCCEVTHTRDALQAVQATRAGDIDLLLVHMQAPAALPLLRTLRADGSARGLPIVLLSGSDDRQERESATRFGAADYIAGTYSDLELATRVESALRMHRHVGETSTTLRQSIDRFREMADNSPVMIWVANAAGDVTFLNRVWSEFTGVDAEDALGMRWLDLLHPDDRDRTIEQYREACEGHAPCRLEYRMRRADGEWRWAIDTAAPYIDALGEFHGYIGTVTDTTERKQIEEGLHRTNVQLEKEIERRTAERDRIWHVSSELMGVAAYDGRLRSVNPAWTRTLGIAEAQLLAMSHVDLVHTDDQAALREIIGRLRGGELMLRFENRLRRNDGAYRWISWTASPASEVFYLVGRDITEEKEREEALAATEELLRQSQKMEAIGHLTGGVAHDFNNLLTVVIGNLDTVQRMLENDTAPRLKRAVDNAMHGAQRAAALTQQLLAFARRQPLDPSVLDVNELVASMSELLRRTLGEHVTIDTVLAERLWHAEADRNQLENALLNLAVNARDAMPNGGKLIIRTANARIDSGSEHRNDELKVGDYVCIEVVDTGVGMERAVLDRVFEPFFTTKPTGHGTGLGLSQVYGFVKQSGGHIRIQSEVGVGTTVCLYLPRLVAPLTTTIETATQAIQGRCGHETVLVVEDEDSVRKYSCEILRELGYRVIEARDGAAALAALQRDAQIAVLFTDVGLPGLGGRELAARALRLRPNVKVLFTTGYARDALSHQGRLDPTIAVINKPFRYAELAARLRSILEDGNSPS